MKLIIASNNAHKVSEIKAILGCFYDEILSLREAGIDMDVVEDADTFEGNALKKAREVFAVADADAVLSDDSGLMVDALGGAPGVYSARYAGEGHDDAANNAKLLDALRDVPDEKRTARFCTSVAGECLPSPPTAAWRGSYSTPHKAKTASATTLCSIMSR